MSLCDTIFGSVSDDGAGSGNNIREPAAADGVIRGNLAVAVWRFSYCIEDSCQLGPSVVA